MAGLEPQVVHIEGALEEIALDRQASLSAAQIGTLIADAHAARSRIHQAAYRQLHRDPYHAGLGPSILARVPSGLDELVERVVTGAASRLGFRVEQVRGRRAYAIEFGNEAIIDSLPGVPGGTAFVGTFDRDYAVEDETIDFFASGHPLVEGLLAHFEENPAGRVVRLEVQIPGEAGEGIVAIYKDGPRFEIVAVDSAGRTRPEWAAAFARPGLRAERLTAGHAPHEWPAVVARLAERLGDRSPHAVAGVVVHSS